MEALIWIIGALFTIGALTTGPRYEAADVVEKFIVLLLCAAVWPFVLGVVWGSSQ